ncbi:MAG: type II and III secretion system protein family protein [Alphaproteobacteria bacterium]
MTMPRSSLGLLTAVLAAVVAGAGTADAARLEPGLSSSVLAAPRPERKPDSPHPEVPRPPRPPFLKLIQADSGSPGPVPVVPQPRPPELAAAEPGPDETPLPEAAPPAVAAPAAPPAVAAPVPAPPVAPPVAAPVPAPPTTAAAPVPPPARRAVAPTRIHVGAEAQSRVQSLQSDVDEAEVVELAVAHSRLIELPVPVRDVMLSSAAVADVVVKRSNQIFIVGRTPGQTNVILLNHDGKVIRRLEVRVRIDIGALTETLKKLFPEERIRPESVGDSVFLAGTVRSPAAAATAMQVARRFVAKDENIVNVLKVSDEQQVLLRVRVAEVQKTTLKELGFYPLINRLTFGNLTSFTPNSGIGLVSSSPAAWFGQGSFFYSKGKGALPDFSLMIQALERQGLIRTLAEPNLTAISGETAKMLAGGEYPIPTSNTNGNIGITFKQFGVALGFSPVVVAPGKISLKLSSEVSALDRDNQVSILGTTIPGLKVRRAETSVELASGGSLMIAGMLQNDMIEALNGIPGIKDVPVLGQLFRSESFQKSESELVVMVSAYVVQPVDNNMLALPTDGLVPASDLDFYLLGRLYHVYSGGEGPPPAESLQGPVGYIMD